MTSRPTVPAAPAAPGRLGRLRATLRSRRAERRQHLAAAREQAGFAEPSQPLAQHAGPAGTATARAHGIERLEQRRQTA